MLCETSQAQKMYPLQQEINDDIQFSPLSSAPDPNLWHGATHTGGGAGGGAVFLPQLKLSSNTFTDKPWCIYLQVIPALLRQTVEIHHHKFPFLGIGDSAGYFWPF